MARKWIRRKAAAKKLGVSEPTFDKYAKEGRVVAGKVVKLRTVKIDHSVWTTEEDMDAFLLGVELSEDGGPPPP